ncbi:MAG: hypothetical protein OXL98_03540 [Acidimicrobiaceae bacterium]|nr:hypothetical protein [Acidimicrobiaceae bacterium]
MTVAGLPDLGPVDGAPASAEAWERAWEQYLHYRGDPVAVMSEAGRNDGSFVMGPVFAAVYRVLAGSPVHAATLRSDTRRAVQRAEGASDRERSHVRALNLLVAGEFTAAARAWDAVAAAGRDFAAVRFAHDVYLHVGDDVGRLNSSCSAEEAWRDEPGWGFVAGQHAFALEEVGRYDESEELGLAALGLDPDDLWARHALAHVYESTDDTPAALALLEGSVERWNGQELLATHIWWHLALRLLASGDSGGALAIFDERQPLARTAFQLCDQTSLLWRLELAGCSAGDRWDTLADRWDEVAERHTCGFLDVHAALAFVRRPEHPGARRWFRGLAEREAGTSENDRTFMGVVAPLAHAFRTYAAGDTDRFVGVVDGLGRSTRWIGGSIAQRDLITLTRRAADAAAGLSTLAPVHTELQWVDHLCGGQPIEVPVAGPAGDGGLA